MQKQWFYEEPFQAFWEKSYRDPAVSSMGGPSLEVAEILPCLPRRAKVLDLGCGEGRNAFFLARNGCDVTAVDRSAAGIEKLMRVAKEQGVELRGIVGDITEFLLEESYDLVMAHGVLYYLENPVWRALLQRLMEWTRPGGFHLITLFVYSDEYPCGEEIGAAGYRGSFSPGEIREFYDDWNVHRFDQYVKWDAHPGVPLHCHPIEKLAAQKPLPMLECRGVAAGEDMEEGLFHRIEMGMGAEALRGAAGEPHAIVAKEMAGEQFGAAGSAVTSSGHCLELWYYGRYVIYLENGRVTGRAICSTDPIELALN